MDSESTTSPGHRSAKPSEDTPHVPTERKVEVNTILKGREIGPKERAENRLDEKTNQSMLHHEQNSMPKTDYLSQHPTLDQGMRSVLIDWMMEVCREFEMQRESFNLAICLLDRFLSRVAGVHQSKLQLVGVAVMLISAKAEEIYPPKVHELALITDGAFSTGQLRSMEKCILEKLDWDVYFVTPFRWIIHYLKRVPVEHLKSGCAKHSMCEAMALLDLCLLDYKAVAYLPSCLASAALASVLKLPPKLFTKVTGRPLSDVYECMGWMSQFEWLVVQLMDAPTSRGWCCPDSSLYRNVVHHKDVHLVQPYFADAIEQLKKHTQH
eukprot:TRINITY_DN560_c0_g1_i1.p1 TRINITY_DN560_c0_g1~~TRINITY_DN560_c0_g1_i1.p1  ORF type:complete len:324 (+),score=77.64 TRINITY_DN560_c0_g1_i1:631-1602(+)